jgi:ATP-dependent Lon protease
MLKVPDGTIRILVQGMERVRISDYVAEEPYLVARIEPLPDEVEPSPELEAPDPKRSAHVHGDHRADPVPAGGAPARRGERRRSLRAHAPDRGCAPDLLAGEAGAARAGGRREEAPPPVGDPARELEVIQIGSRIQSQVQSEIDKASASTTCVSS